RSVCPELDYAASAVSAAADAEVLLLVTEWPEFADADPEVLGKAVARRNVLDARHALDPGVWRAAGWHYGAPGRPRGGSAERYHRRLRRGVMLRLGSSRSNAETPDDVQHGNRAWWTRHPMTYDFTGEVQLGRGTPEWFAETDRRFID